MNELLRKLRWLFHRRQFESDLEEEIEHHLALQSQDIGDIHAASRRFGNIELLKENSRAMWTFTFWEQFAQDIRYGFRTMASNRLFTAMAVLSLALGIGANTAIYSFMHAILLRSLPVRHAEELVTINWHSRDFPEVAHGFDGNVYKSPTTGETSGNQPYAAYELLRAPNPVLRNVFAFTSAGRITIAASGGAELTRGEYVTGNYFSALGVRPAAGRLFVDEDDRFGAPPLIAISYNLWRRRFAADPAAVGKTILLNNSPVTIVGVSAPEFFGVAPGDAPDVFIPLHALPNAAVRFADRNRYWVQAMGRLQPNVSLAQAQAALSPLYSGYIAETALTAKERADLPALLLQEGRSGIDALRRQYSKPLYVLMTMVGLLLAIACANIASLLLSRAAARRREIAVRLSLGAGRLRVIRQLLTESVLLGVTAGILGICAAKPGIRFLEWLIANGRDDFRTGASLDWPVLAFTIALALLTSIAFGLVPAIQATKIDVAPALKESRFGLARGRVRGIDLGRLLVISQIALSLVLVTAAGLFARTLSNLESSTLGFNRDNLLLFSMQPAQTGYKGGALADLYDRLQKRISTLPGVRGVTLSDTALIAGAISRHDVKSPGVNLPAGRNSAATLIVGPEFFSTMQIPILLGREIGGHDGADAPRVAVVNETFARDFFKNSNPIGRRVRLGRDRKEVPDMEIVGLAKTARYHSLKEDIGATIYIPYRQEVEHLNYMSFEVRTTGDPLAYAGSIRKIVQDVAPRVPVFNFMTQAAQIDRTTVQERMFADLCTCFAVLALGIACIGLYGKMAYAVSRRTNEIGIRVALGAERRRIMWMVLREVLAVSVAGLAIGLAAALSAGHFVDSFLFGMKARDPVALSCSAALLLASAVAAGFAPAWRASRIEPMEALRHE